MSLNVDVVSLSYFHVCVFFFVCLQLHVSNKVGFSLEEEDEEEYLNWYHLGGVLCIV